MKEYSLDSILARNDYKHMTSVLKEKVEYVAKRIFDKMLELDVDEPITIHDITLSLEETYTTSVGCYDYLAIVGEDDGIWHSLFDINHTYYYGGDFGAKVVGANNKEALAFLNAAKDLIVELDNLETLKVDEIKNALEKTKDI